MEAAIMTQLDDFNDESILYLIRFKNFVDVKQWRFYFESCPYGDLETLRLRYNAWGYVLSERPFCEFIDTFKQDGAPGALPLAYIQRTCRFRSDHGKRSMERCRGRRQ